MVNAAHREVYAEGPHRTWLKLFRQKMWTEVTVEGVVAVVGQSSVMPDYL